MQTHTSATRPQVLPGTNSQRSLAGYLAGTIGTAAVLAAPQADAAVTAVTFGFGSVFNLSSTDGMQYMSPSGGALFFEQSANAMRVGARPTYGWGSVYQTASVGPYIGQPTFLANGTVVGGGGNGTPGFAYFQSPDAPVDFTADQNNRNIGFVTNSGNYGWANVSWNETAKSLTVNEAWVESTAGVPITVNAAAVPEPSRALLALAGLGGLSLRRRRKLVA